MRQSDPIRHILTLILSVSLLLTACSSPQAPTYKVGIISALTTKYRDLSILISFGVGLLMYATPVVYPLSFLKQSKYAAFIRWNPLSSLVEGFRYAVLGQGELNIYFFTYSIGFTVITLLCGVLLFNKVERNFMDTV